MGKLLRRLAARAESARESHVRTRPAGYVLGVLIRLISRHRTIMASAIILSFTVMATIHYTSCSNSSTDLLATSGRHPGMNGLMSQPDRLPFP